MILVAALASAGCAASATGAPGGRATPAGTAASSTAAGATARATRAATTSSTASGAAVRNAALAGIAMSGITKGHGLFTSRAAGRCLELVAATSDGGAAFQRPAVVTSWPCAGAAPADALALAGADGFVYGPQLFATHDGGRTWAPQPQPGPVLAVAPIGRSVWMVEASCKPGSGMCGLRLMESADGGRSWAPAPAQPSGALIPAGQVTQPIGATAGQTWLARAGASAGYLVGPPDTNGSGQPDSVPIWFTSDGGLTWSRRPAPCGLDAMSAAVSAAPGGTVLAVCAGQPAAGNQGKAAALSMDGGRTWSVHAPCPAADPLCPSGTALDSGYLGGVRAVSATVAYLYGARSSLLVTRDGGARWRAVRPLVGDDSGGSGPAWFSGADGVVLATGGDTNEKPALWRTADGGIRWSRVTPVLG